MDKPSDRIDFNFDNFWPTFIFFNRSSLFYDLFLKRSFWFFGFSRLIFCNIFTSCSFLLCDIKYFKTWFFILGSLLSLCFHFLYHSGSFSIPFIFQAFLFLLIRLKSLFLSRLTEEALFSRWNRILWLMGANVCCHCICLLLVLGILSISLNTKNFVVCTPGLFHETWHAVVVLRASFTSTLIPLSF